MTNTKYPKVSGEEVQVAVLKAKLDRVYVRSCSICNYRMHYVFHDGQPYYDAGCDCSSMGPSDPQLRSWQDIARLINIQPAVEARNSIRQDFGLPPEAT